MCRLLSHCQMCQFNWPFSARLHRDFWLWVLNCDAGIFFFFFFQIKAIAGSFGLKGRKDKMQFPAWNYFLNFSAGWIFTLGRFCLIKHVGLAALLRAYPKAMLWRSCLPIFISSSTPSSLSSPPPETLHSHAWWHSVGQRAMTLDCQDLVIGPSPANL